MVRESSVMERRLTFVIQSIQGDGVLEKDVHYSVLTVVTGHMESRAPMGIHGLRLWAWWGEGGLNFGFQVISIQRNMNTS